MALNIGKQIRRFRRAKGLSCEALAELSGISSKGLNNIELGKSKPKFYTVKRIVEALGISFDDLINENHPLIIDLI